jgi:hypothetical protein
MTFCTYFTCRFCQCLLNLLFTVKIVIQRGKPFGVIFLLFLLIDQLVLLIFYAAQFCTVAASCLLSFSAICQHIEK